MCAPRVTRHTSLRYRSSCHTRVNMGISIFFTAAKIRAFRSAKSHGNGGTYYYVPPLPCELPLLLARIIATAKHIDAPMLTRVWQELKYRIHVCRVTRGAYIGHLYLSKNLFRFSRGCEQFH
jgi:hypothetical protein